MKRFQLMYVVPTPVLAALASAVLACSCVDPLDITTPRRQWEVNIDSVVGSDPFVRAPGDSILARVGGNDVVFASEVQRPTFHNGVYRDAHYVTVQASRHGLSGGDYEIVSLRLDAVRDTGTYAFNAAYSAPKSLDSNAAPIYAAQYDRRVVGGLPQSYRTGTAGTSGIVRVVRIDEALGVMVGTFSFTARSAEHDTTITISRGAFRVQLKK